MYKNLILKNYRGIPINVVYHKNCLDGLMAAAIMSKIMDEEDRPDAKFIPCQYGETLQINNHEIVIFVDFSLKRPEMMDIISRSKQVFVYDHHLSARDELKDLDIDYPNFSFEFNNEICGTEIVYNTIYKNNYSFNINPTIPLLMTDMDLFMFKKPITKGFRMYLEFDTQKKNLEKAKTYLSHTDEELSDIADKGDLLDKFVWNHAEKISTALIKKEKKPIKICDFEFMALNAVDRVSELGNQICKDHHKMSLMYFITDENNVVCSLRSMDYLPDAGKIATFFGGGGHRNACGFQIPLEQLLNFLNNGFEKVIKYNFVATIKVPENIVTKTGEDENGKELFSGTIGYTDEKVSGYYYMSKTGRPLMFVWNNKALHYKNNVLNNIDIDYTQPIELN